MLHLKPYFIRNPNISRHLEPHRFARLVMSVRGGICWYLCDTSVSIERRYKYACWRALACPWQFFECWIVVSDP